MVPLPYHYFLRMYGRPILVPGMSNLVPSGRVHISELTRATDVSHTLTSSSS